MRTATGARSDVAQVSITPVGVQGGTSGALALTGVWELQADHGWFGGFSALATSGPGRVIAGTDRGFLLDLDLSGAAPRAVPGSFRFVGHSPPGRTEVVDLEALAHDPASGTLWAAFENDNALIRYAADGTRTFRRPREMRNWSQNSGPETMERLADGRFLVIAEGSETDAAPGRAALLFAGDPMVGTRAPVAFRFVPEPGFDPVDAALLNDGRMLILLRRVAYAIPARFDTSIALADPAAIRPGQPWRAQVIQRLSGGVLADNFEGITFIPDPSDPARGSIWVIADDNFSVFQRSLLARFAWDSAAIPRADEPLP